MAEYDDLNYLVYWYAYGNYIDEVLLTGYYSGLTGYSVHDHLYSPVVLIDAFNGNVGERYEYDAYGNPTVMYSDYSEKEYDTYFNKFLFTGRELDVFDSGNLKIQNNRNRYAAVHHKYDNTDTNNIVPRNMEALMKWLFSDEFFKDYKEHYLYWFRSVIWGHHTYFF